MGDENAAMASPVIAYQGDSENEARQALINRLYQHANYGHVKQRGDSERFNQAADEIVAGAFSVKPAHRIQRVRAMLMPKEQS